VRTKTAAQEEKILKAAARLFAGHRFHEARMEDIAAVAGVGKGTVYRYFKDKEELYLALLARAADEISRRLREALAAVPNPRGRLEAVVAVSLAYFDEHPHLLDLITHAEALHKHDAEFPWQKARAESLAVVERILREGTGAGAFAVADPPLATLLLLGALRAVIRFGARPRPPDLARRITDLFLHGASPPPAACAPRGGRRRASGPSPG
jgi:TetR/AcrR family fatty acid metabolism transcriptional regulator